MSKTRRRTERMRKPINATITLTKTITATEEKGCIVKQSRFSATKNYFLHIVTTIEDAFSLTIHKSLRYNQENVIVVHLQLNLEGFKIGHYGGCKRKVDPKFST